MSTYDQKELEQWKKGLLGKQDGSSKKILLVILIAVVVVVAYLYLSK